METCGCFAWLIEANLLENSLRQTSWRKDGLKVVKTKWGLQTESGLDSIDQIQPSVFNQWENKNYFFRKFFSNSLTSIYFVVAETLLGILRCEITVGWIQEQSPCQDLSSQNPMDYLPCFAVVIASKTGLKD